MLSRSYIIYISKSNNYKIYIRKNIVLIKRKTTHILVKVILF